MVDVGTHDPLERMVRRGRRLVDSAGEVLRGIGRAGAISVQVLSPLQVPAVLAAAIRNRATPYGALLAVHAARTPHKTALVDSQVSWTWAELDARTNRLANALVQRGDGGRVAFMLPNRAEAIEVLVAAAKGGIMPVPVNTRFHTEEVTRLLRVQGVETIVVDADHAARVSGFGGRVVTCGDEYETLLADASPTPPTPRARSGSEEQGGIVIHTSGTTGHPKGAERDFTESGIIPTLAFLSRIPFRHEDVVLVPAPVFHALGLAGVVVPLAMGATIVLEERFDPPECLARMADHDVSGLVVVPVMLRRLCDAVNAGQGSTRWPHLAWIWCSGSALPPALERRSRRIFGPVVRNLYGSTEAGWVSVATPEDAVLKPGTVGRPLPGIEVRIVGEDGRELDTGEVGEIVVRSEAVFAGYTDDAGGGLEVDGTYRPGDMGWLDADGYLFVADRADDMVVTGGENVYPAEVERVLHEEPSILDAAVVGVADPEYGDVLAAFVVPREAGALDGDRVRTICREHLANFKVPKHIWLVESLPYNATGKVLRRQLRADAGERLGAETAVD
ncbi:MAG: AMP-binding protein [Acidimicrobiia bacterium]|nr:AMP-binding protein [Acidimicrobiia bacterium]